MCTCLPSIWVGATLLSPALGVAICCLVHLISLQCGHSPMCRRHFPCFICHMWSVNSRLGLFSFLFSLLVRGNMRDSIVTVPHFTNDIRIRRHGTNLILAKSALSRIWLAFHICHNKSVWSDIWLTAAGWQSMVGGGLNITYCGLLLGR